MYLVGGSFDFDGDAVFRKDEDPETGRPSVDMAEYKEDRNRREGGMRDTKSRMATGGKTS
jgi:hypothetical protein